MKLRTTLIAVTAGNGTQRDRATRSISLRPPSAWPSLASVAASTGRGTINKEAR